MFAFRPRLRALIVGAAAFLLGAVGAGSAVAGSNPPTLYACFNQTGAVAMSTANMCKLVGGGQLVAVNTQGVQGSTGPQGATGPTGATGGSGPTGVSGYEVVTQSSQFDTSQVNDGALHQVLLSCPNGKVALGSGGYGKLFDYQQNYLGPVYLAGVTMSVFGPELLFGMPGGGKFPAGEVFWYTAWVTCAAVGA